MTNDEFRWNPYADQPHNVAPKRERLRHHIKFSGGYLRLIGSNLRKAVPVLMRYQWLRKNMYQWPVSIRDPFSASVSMIEGKEEEVLAGLKDLGIDRTFVRIPSWEREKLPDYEHFIRGLRKQGFDISLGLLQRRADVLDPGLWKGFLEEAFSRFSGCASVFQIGHAWNRTKWGVWDYREYIKLLEAAYSAAIPHGARLVGPSVIDFEFHLYPPLLKRFAFDFVSSLLYVDRVGAPENTQYGWDMPKKLALLRAIVDKCSGSKTGIWITEMNWPLEGTGKYSPVSGKPNVSEQSQADYLIRYFVLAAAGGFIERIYWWQMVAPGYGLIDNREPAWRKRPSFYAMKTLVANLHHARFQGCFAEEQAKIFMFCREKEVFAVAWTMGTPLRYSFPGKVIRVIDFSGQETKPPDNRVDLSESPCYVYFQE